MGRRRGAGTIGYALESEELAHVRIRLSLMLLLLLVREEIVELRLVKVGIQTRIDGVSRPHVSLVLVECRHRGIDREQIRTLR